MEEDDIVKSIIGNTLIQRDELMGEEGAVAQGSL